jgi:AhpD family alkylhydroperoxidase
MSRNNEDPGRLSNREKELVALGAAIASDCIPCIEYHIPQARKSGLSDCEITQAVALADKVRRIPAAKVLQTASALLEGQDRARSESEDDVRARPELARHPGEPTATETIGLQALDVRLDSEHREEDNNEMRACCGEDAEDSTPTGESGGATTGSPNAADHSGFDFSKMMEMMRHCCPDKMKDISSMMSSSEKGRCFPGEKAGSKESA